MAGYVLRSDYWHGYLQFLPYDGRIAWAGTAASQHAHTFTIEDAVGLLQRLPADDWKLSVIYVERDPVPVPQNANVPAAVEVWAK